MNSKVEIPEAIQAAMDEEDALHIVIYPWFAMGHIIPCLHFSNKLAKRGHQISFIIPKSTQSKLLQFNHFPHLITFIPITVPHCDGLPENADTTSDVPFSLVPLLMTAMDRTEKDIEQLLLQLNPHIVFFDFVQWLPSLTCRLGFKSLQLLIGGNPATGAYVLCPERMLKVSDLTEADLMKPPSGFPCSSIKLHLHEAKLFAWKRKREFGSGLSLYDRLYIGSTQADAIAYRGSAEIEGPFVDFLGIQYGKPTLLAGPVIPEPSSSVLDEKLAKWLSEFKNNSVVYCALGSECVLEKTQFQELLLGLELTGFPFLAALKPPSGFESMEAAMPEGFQEKVEGRGVVHGGWVQQQAILGHISVGCFITHCGSGSLKEGLVNTCQLVLLPFMDLDQIINARMMSSYLKVGVEVEKGEEDGLFTREAVCKAVRSVMDDESEVSREIRENHGRLRSHLLSKDLESSYVDGFCIKLRELLK